MDKAGRVVDGSAFAEKTTAFYRTADIEIREVQNKAGERSIAITLEKFPSMTIRGTAPNEQGEFYLISLEYLEGSIHGWNEYRMDLFGSGMFAAGETDAVFFISDEFESVQISSGRIRFHEKWITGTEALTNLRNRNERIIALAEWMSEQNPSQTDRKAFENYWTPVLFPEIVSRRNRPEGWLREGDIRVRSDDILWNMDYTERVFPEELRAVRNSGTMLRDWEEALEWIYIKYEWSRITELLSQETVLTKTRR